MIRARFEIAPQAEPEKALRELIASSAGENAAGFEIRKRSIDSRKGKNRFVYTVDIAAADPGSERELASSLGGEVFTPEQSYTLPIPARLPDTRPVVAGFGPAGIFAALCLARAGMKPIVLERGRPVDERVRDVEAFFRSGTPDVDSNVQFGEGGAGAFSDGKLNTLVKDKSFIGGFVLRELVKAGAPDEILYLSHPHVGTDLLRGVVKNLRREIISLGGEVRFGARLEDIAVGPDGALESVVVNGETLKTGTLFLAVGQSAPELIKTLYKRGVPVESKPFSVGFRIEHPQSLINRSQYGAGGDLRFLPPAEYKLYSHTATGRTVYSFCMCPGGSVIAASSSAGRIVTNGMSLHARDGANANSAILCEVLPGDLGGVFDGFDYRKGLEEKAFALGGGTGFAPAMTLGSFLGAGGAAPAVEPTYLPGVRYADLRPLFTAEMLSSFREAFADFARKVRNFDLPGAVLTAVESRTSSPVRVTRNENRQSDVAGIYPLGEGAGYAGGIMSAAIDAIKSVREYVLSL